MLRWGVTVGMFLMGCSSTEPEDHTPQVGRYAFATEWFVPDPLIPGTTTATGLLVITAASPDEISWTLTVDGKAKSGMSSWSDLNDYVVTSASIGRAGSWVLLPHLGRTAHGYECSGNAFSLTYGGQVMTCSFDYLGP